jgi:hypothetical protein
VDKAVVERSRAAAEFVRNAAAALVSLYTGVLGVTYAATATALPATGLVPVIFLGGATVFAAAYVAYATRPRAVAAPIPTSNLLEREVRRLNAYVDWVNEVATRRIYCLHASVLSLGFGAVLLPVPFLRVSDIAAVTVAAGAGAMVLGFPIATSKHVARLRGSGSKSGN